MNNKYKEKKRFLIRFLKENGLYSAYRRYIHSKKTYNVYQKETPNWSFDDCALSNDMSVMISRLIVWDKTKEGYEFWHKLHLKFNDEYRKKFLS